MSICESNVDIKTEFEMLLKFYVNTFNSALYSDDLKSILSLAIHVPLNPPRWSLVSVLALSARVVVQPNPDQTKEFKIDVLLLPL